MLETWTTSSQVSSQHCFHSWSGFILTCYVTTLCIHVPCKSRCKGAQVIGHNGSSYFNLREGDCDKIGGLISHLYAVDMLNHVPVCSDGRFEQSTFCIIRFVSCSGCHISWSFGPNFGVETLYFNTVKYDYSSGTRQSAWRGRVKIWLPLCAPLPRPYSVLHLDVLVHIGLLLSSMSTLITTAVLRGVECHFA